LTAVARFNCAATVQDGVFTGVAWGLHDNRRLYLVGALTINGLRHVGLLADATTIGLQTGWHIGPYATATITNTTTCTVPTTSWPTWAAVGTRFQVFAGHAQAATYVVAAFTQTVATGLTTITLEAAVGHAATWPADYNLVGGQSPVLVFETDWAETRTYRLATNYQAGTATLTIANWPSFTATSTTPLPLPYQTTYVFDTSGQGQVFWGSTSRAATNTSEWSYFRYLHTPAASAQVAQQVVVNAELGALPENDLNAEWYPVKPYGHSYIDSTADQMVLVGSSAGAAQTYGYARQEPLLTAGVYADVRVRFKQTEGTVPGSLRVVVRDGQREVTLGALTYAQVGGARALITLPQASASMGVLPTTEGWGASGGGTTASISGRKLTTIQTANTNGTYTLPVTNAPGVGAGGTYAARVAITSYTAAGNGDIGITFGGGGYTLPDTDNHIGLRAPVGATPAQVVWHNGGVGTAYTFDWTDGLPHTYRVTHDSTNPGQSDSTLTVDDVVIATDIIVVPDVIAPQSVYFGHKGTNATVAVWDYFYWHGEADPQSAERTLGLWRGQYSDDETDINNWVIPRTDASTDLNSVLATARGLWWTTSSCQPALPPTAWSNGVPWRRPA